MKINNIEEDIKVLEKYLFELTRKTPEEIIANDDILKFIEYREIEAIRNLLLRYKLILEENEQLKISNKEIDKECCRLEVKEIDLYEMIDKMAEYIASDDIDEDVCRKVTNGKCCNSYEENSNCKECVIEYFKRAVRKDG